jgi:acetyl esterase
VEQLRELPPALVIVDENDVLRDITAVRVLATHHDFAMLNGLAGTPA